MDQGAWCDGFDQILQLLEIWFAQSRGQVVRGPWCGEYLMVICGEGAYREPRTGLDGASNMFKNSDALYLAMKGQL